jgi:4-carboxymuconolactone decarboxylase
MRLPRLKPDEMTSRQREVHDRIAGKRGHLGAPYRVWIHSPELCDRAEAMSSYVRWECSLPNKLRELSILITARFWDAQYSWNAHVDQTIAAGIDPEAVAAIAEKRKPLFEAEDERVFYQFSMEMLENHFVSDETFEHARILFGDRGIVDIIACIGNFSMLAMCLNTAQADLQPDRKPPFPDIGSYARVTPGKG